MLNIALFTSCASTTQKTASKTPLFVQVSLLKNGKLIDKVMVVTRLEKKAKIDKRKKDSSTAIEVLEKELEIEMYQKKIAELTLINDLSKNFIFVRFPFNRIFIFF